MRIPLTVTWDAGSSHIPDAYEVSYDFCYNRMTIQRPKGLALLWLRIQGFWLDHRWCVEEWCARRIGWYDPDA